jgi:hypothetical protein
MVKPKNLRLVYGKSYNPKRRSKYQRERLKSNFRQNLKHKTMYGARAACTGLENTREKKNYMLLILIQVTME